MEDISYFGIFLSSFLSATILPLSSEAVLSAMVVAGFDIMTIVLVATLGNWLGSLSTYALGYIGDVRRIEKWLKIPREKTDRFREKTEKYGAWFGLIVWVPVVGDVICVCLGLVRTQMVKTAIAILVGKFLRYFFWGYLTEIVLNFVS